MATCRQASAPLLGAGKYDDDGNDDDDDDEVDADDGVGYVAGWQL